MYLRYSTRKFTENPPKFPTRYRAKRPMTPLNGLESQRLPSLEMVQWYVVPNDPRACLIKGHQWVFIVPDHKAGYLLGGGKRSFGGGVPGTLDSHEHREDENLPKIPCGRNDGTRQ